LSQDNLALTAASDSERKLALTTTASDLAQSQSRLENLEEALQQDKVKRQAAEAELQVSQSGLLYGRIFRLVSQSGLSAREYSDL
jgi:hypothetical protein